MFNKLLTSVWGVVLMLLASSATTGTLQPVTKSAYDSYIVIMDSQPIIAYDGNIPGYEATKPGKNKKVNPKSAKVKKYKKKLKDEHNAVLAYHGLQGAKVHDYSMAINGFSVRMSYDDAKKLALSKKVNRVIPDRMYQLTTDNSPTFLDLTGKKGPYKKGINGEGVIIGVIDGGIWPEHDSFADDGSYPDLGIDLDESVYSSCDFGNSAHKPEDVAFDCNNKLIGARQILPTYRAVIGAGPAEYDSARDEGGHGTHTASTAGGNAGVSADILGQDFGLISGIAPRARIIAYKGLGELGGFGSDLAAAIDQAVADGVDVINYSIGSNGFALGPDDIAFLFAESAGVHVATSNGNSGPLPATTGSPASVPWVTSVGASTQNRTYQGSAESSDGGFEFFGASITPGTAELPLVSAADAGDIECHIGALDPVVVSGKIVLCRRGDIARVDKSEAVLVAGGAGMILYNQNDGQSQVTDTHHLPSVHISNTDGLVIEDYIDATADPVATVNGGVYTEIEAPWMAGFSSRGPNRLVSDIIKPDITAPGVNILAGDSPDNRGELFQMISGTSMSSPHVAGLMALMKQEHPDWTPAMVRSAIMTSSHQGVMKEDGVTAADAFDMGAGHVVPGGNPKKKGSMFNPGLVYPAGLFDYAAFSCGQDMGIFAAGDCDFLASIGVPDDPSNLNLPSIGIAQLAGSETVFRTVMRPMTKSNKKKTYHIHVNAPDGYEVSVFPTKLKLAGGESASYAVTIANVSGPLGEWRHGSLAWSSKKAKGSKSGKSHKKSGKKSGKSSKGKKDMIYSPIAVNGALFGSPESVSGGGVDGAASIEVGFGYTGTYSPAAHGLSAAQIDSDTVGQDPDQNFDPGDGLSIPHTIEVTDGALLRIKLPPVSDPNADLDIYLYNPSGELAGISGNGGTDEQIDIVEPETGEWTLYVHGWSVPDPAGQAYDLYSWVVPITPGTGNLMIDSAPATAVQGEVGSVEFSWTAAAAGEWHLGGVSHSGPSGLQGFTLVEVDNR